MKKFLYLLVLLPTILTSNDAAEKYEWTKFETVITIKYNSLTLAEAAAKESEFRNAYSKEACEITVNLQKVITPSSATISCDSTSIFAPPRKWNWQYYYDGVPLDGGGWGTPNVCQDSILIFFRSADIPSLGAGQESSITIP